MRMRRNNGKGFEEDDEKGMENNDVIKGKMQ
jgi:hypothetical protein